ncbi:MULTISPECIES: hypothetical protein [Rummeliibacillus]|uniref:hypothetical protein n=1 Tax=Rummeliibacillus TaxID=648802 RepID=UPI0011B3FC0E|nr:MULTISPECIES: hypothetical protein [Rummeliibacillus]MBO2535180.1 hypothetical protein [Rummeliibacillus suwonensis]
MNALEKKLTNKIKQDPKTNILATSSWCFPIQTVEFNYKPVKRLTMDILMKMILLSCKQAEIADSKELSDLLLVEKLFIQDLLQNLQNKGLVEKTSYYQLTTKGEKQLENGIYEEEQEEETQHLFYSATHQSFLAGDLEASDDFENLPETFAYASEESVNIAEEIIFKALQENRSTMEKEDLDQNLVQTFITSIESQKTIQINDIPCIQFIIYNEEKDLLYVRVWNTFIGHWDEALEKILMENELVKWREEYLEGKE